VRFSLKKRDDSPFYFATFSDSQGRRRELTTGQKAHHAAEETAWKVIADAYQNLAGEQVPWDEAIERMQVYMQAGNLRPGSIQQYVLIVGTLRKLFPETSGPADITSQMAEDFKVRRMTPPDGGRKLSSRTVAGNVLNLSIVWGRWFRDTMHLVGSNPFEAVDPPKSDKKAPRVIADDERKAFFDWLQAAWGWRLPLLFLEVKSLIGCRISELASAHTASLKDGRITFLSETTKGRKQRACRLPAALFAELEAIAGPVYVFERFSAELRGIHLKRGRPNLARRVGTFAPARLVGWLQDRAADYFHATQAEHFKLHQFRGSAMSRARQAGIGESDAAIAFGCNPSTMREHYLALDETAIADEVFSRLGAKS
jgi:integrase